MENTKVAAILGNIVKQPDCDGIVNAANRNLRAGSGVCGAIYAAAGPRLEPYSSQFAPVEIGEAIATPAFDLGCRYIIHVVGPKYLFDADPAQYLAAAITNAVTLADENGLERLAVPAISMGVYAYPPDEAVPILVETTFSILASLRSLKEIRFVVISDDLLTLFNTAIARMDQPKSKHISPTEDN